MTKRTIFYDYFEVNELPVGEIPYSSIDRALKHEVYFRKFQPTFPRKDLMAGNLSALLYWYPKYIIELYDLVYVGEPYTSYFRQFPEGILEGFRYLFPESIKKFENFKANSENHLGEIKLKGIK